MFSTGDCDNALFDNTGNNVTTCAINNLIVQGNNKNNVPFAFHYGHGSLPPDNTQLVVCGKNYNLGQQPFIIGALNTFNYPQLNIQKGESYDYSTNWFVHYKNDGVVAYKLNNHNYTATLPSGEWCGYLIQNRITELENIINEINNNYTTLLAWAIEVQTSLQQLGKPVTTSLSQANLPMPSTLNDDTNYITNQNYLLNDNAIVVP